MLHVHTQVWLPVLQVIGVHQATVDAYLEDIVSLAVDRTASAQARREVQQMAAIINDAAYDAEQRLSLNIATYTRRCNVHICRLSPTEELFQSLPPVAGMNYHVTSRLHHPCEFSAFV